MNTQEGDSQRDGPRRLTEYRMAPRAAGRRLGEALTQLARDRWVGGRKGKMGLPQYHIKFRVSFKVSVASLGLKIPLSRFLFVQLGEWG